MFRIVPGRDGHDGPKVPGSGWSGKRPASPDTVEPDASGSAEIWSSYPQASEDQLTTIEGGRGMTAYYLYKVSTCSFGRTAAGEHSAVTVKKISPDPNGVWAWSDIGALLTAFQRQGHDNFSTTLPRGTKIVDDARRDTAAVLAALEKFGTVRIGAESESYMIVTKVPLEEGTVVALDIANLRYQESLLR